MESLSYRKRATFDFRDSLTTSPYVYKTLPMPSVRDCAHHLTGEGELLQKFYFIYKKRLLLTDALLNNKHFKYGIITTLTNSFYSIQKVDSMRLKILIYSYITMLPTSPSQGHILYAQIFFASQYGCLP